MTIRRDGTATTVAQSNFPQGTVGQAVRARQQIPAGTYDYEVYMHATGTTTKTARGDTAPISLTVTDVGGYLP